MGELAEGRHDRVVTEAVAGILADLGHERHESAVLDEDELALRLGRHVGDAVTDVLQGLPPDERLDLARTLLATIDAGAAPASPARALQIVRPAVAVPGGQDPPEPLVPLASHDLLVNAHGQPTLGSVLQAEIASADRVDLVVAFVTWAGVRLVADELARAVQRGVPVRLLTTTFTGTTEPEAVRRLHERGVRVRVSYDTGVTRLHAKTWMLHRDSGFSTALVGSSNLTRTALLDGREWNVRVARAAAPALFDKLDASFEAAWASPEFQPFDSASLPRLRDAVDAARGTGGGRAPIEVSAGLRLTPLPFQEEILDALTAERTVHGSHRNLVVAPTGTGKTVVAALDYARLREPLGRDPSLLFVAHREQILHQARATYRVALRDPSFGELLAGGNRPSEHRHVFATIQSLSSHGPDRWPADHFDVVVVDEFHHGAARTYEELLDHVQPQVLLALTATPERSDLRDVRRWTDGRTAFDMRLWHALDQQLLTPFQYFGVADTIDYRTIDFRQGRYDLASLGEVVTGDRLRAGMVLEQLGRIVAQPRRMRALAFCATVDHAHFMAAVFADHGLPAVALDASSPQEERDQAVRRLERGELCCIFTRDLFNEGVDIPSVDTILLLRPTESVTVHLQQVGRGLRRLDGKTVCTVLDFVGQHRREYRYDQRLRALTGLSRPDLVLAAERGFPYLPSGCHLELDRQAAEWVLDNLRAGVASGKAALKRELRLQAQQHVDPRGPDLASFVRQAGLEVEDVGRGRAWGYTSLRRELGLAVPEAGEQEARLVRGLGRYHHADDEHRLDLLLSCLDARRPPDVGSLDVASRRTLWGFLVSLWGVRYAPSTMDHALGQLWSNPAVMEEARSILGILRDRIDHATRAVDLADVPVRIGATYGRDELLAGLGGLEPGDRTEHQAGPWWSEALSTSVLFITLEKSAERYSPETRYRDHAVSRELFHWETPHTTARDSPVAARWLLQHELGTTVLLAVRERPTDAWGATAPYVLLGPAHHVSDRGERPIAIRWRLEHPIPAAMHDRFVAAAA